MSLVAGQSLLGTHILIAHAQHKVFALVEDLSYPGPVVVGDCRFVSQHNYTARRQSQVVLDTVLALWRIEEERFV